jgi:hypothetical protein
MVDFVARLRVPLSVAGRILMVAGLLISTAASSVAAQTRDPAAQDPQQSTGPHLVLENVGQYAGEARFLLKQGNRRIWLTEDAVWLTVPDPRAADEQAAPSSLGPLSRARPNRESQPAARRGTAIRFTFPGADGAASLEPFGRVSTQVSYLIGNDPADWQRDVPVWSGMRYRGLYPGVDLVIGDGAAGLIPWRLDAQPGADLRAVTLRAEGVDSVAAGAGQLRLEIGGRTINVPLPTWSVAGQPAPVTSVVQDAGADSFVLVPDAGPQAGEAPAVAAAPVASPENILYSFGGTAWDKGYGIAVDVLGNAYVTGESESDDFPAVPGPATPGTNAFVAKINAEGTGLLYATYLGGSGLDLGSGIALDGNLASIVGKTDSADFPRAPRAAQGYDIFVAALNADGTDLRYASLLGGVGSDAGFGIALDGTGTYVVGETASQIDNTNCTGTSAEDVVVAKLNTAGALSYTTCLGGVDLDTGSAIAVRGGVAYVTGQTWSYDFPGGTGRWDGDIIVAIFDANGALLRSKGLGGPRADSASSIAVDVDSNIYVAGVTESFEFFSGIMTGWGGGTTDGVVLKYDSMFSSASYFATYLGGTGEDAATGIALDTVQGLYLTGTTTSTNFPGTPGRVGADADAFVARMHLGSTAPYKVTYAT